MLRKNKNTGVRRGGRDTALRLLARREHSAAELAEKLKRRGHGEARAIVDRLAAEGWQSDARYAQMLVRHRIEQGYGPLRIRAELAAARVPDAQVRAALDDADVDWLARCAALRARKFRNAPGTPAEWRRQYRYLASRGFSAETVRAVLKDAGGDPRSAFEEEEAGDWEPPEA
ncbi:regulatory protein [Fontimonas thermophila]|uniref:Regulatory protein RecX n=1 Tax=Fontimonas thermophila TaxID=1076937 RepID=A0A1I2IAD9_9GAMM|nr:regulatory protein RecX [Fontimonas thermophila]SFF39319.1 regulatory protein [Fontimonas thermophila]